jgi:short subunit dehydrogenase-like uncharacterized protein
MNEIWILGATGRGGRAIAEELARSGRELVLVGRDEARLESLLAGIGRGAPASLRVARSLDDALLLVAQARPAALINTIGPFTQTTLPAATAAVQAGAAYVDLANELAPVGALLDLDAVARDAGVTLVTGAGFGVVATEALALNVRGEAPPARTARVAAMPVVDGLGPAVLSSVVDSLAGGGAMLRDGRIVPMRLGSGFERLRVPDGSSIGTVAVPTGEILAAQAATGAGEIVAASSEVPSAAPIRAILPLAGRLMARPAVRRAAHRAIDRWRLQPPARSGEFSWAHARLTWTDGTVREGWLRAGEGYAFTARVAALVASRLADGDGRPGAFTPAALLGPEIALSAGAEFLPTQTGVTT